LGKNRKIAPVNNRRKSRDLHMITYIMSKDLIIPAKPVPAAAVIQVGWHYGS